MVFNYNEILSESAVNIEAATGYTNIGRILYENAVNERLLFENVLGYDFYEVHERAALTEGAELSEEVLTTIYEATGGESFFAKVKNAILKFLGKVKGFILNAVEKFRQLISRDHSAYVKRTKDVFIKKNLSKMEWKHCPKPSLQSFLSPTTHLQHLSTTMMQT